MGSRSGFSRSVLLIWGALLAAPAESALVYDWFLTNASQTVGPFDTVLINGRIENDASSEDFDLDVAITQANAAFSPLPGASPYDIKFGPSKTNVLSQFDGVTLAPGESLDFVFATWLPDPGPIPAGIYAALSTSLTINGVDDPGGVVIITVEEAAAIPLPGGIALFGSALAILGWRRQTR